MVLAALIALSACQDGPTLPYDSPVGPSAARSGGGGGGPGESEYQCYTSVATPAGPHVYAYKRVPLRFPATALHSQNATHRYRYRSVAPNGVVIRAANCVIPRTPRAIEAMNRRFGVSADDQMQIQGCVRDGLCTLEPVIVVGDGGGSGGTWGGGGGGVGDPGGADDGACMTSVGDFENLAGCPGGGDFDPGEPDAWDDGTGRPACTRNANGFCVTRPLTQAEWDRFAQRVQEIRETSPECAGAKRVLNNALAQGPASQRIRFWDGYDKPSETEQRYGQRLADPQGNYVEYDSYWVWDRAEMPTLIVHEGLHLYFAENPHPTLSGPELHAYIYSIEESCI